MAWRDTTAEREKCPLASSAPRNRANLRRDETRCACAMEDTSCPLASSAPRNGANFRRGETRCACAVEDTSCPSVSRAFIGRGKILAWRDTTAEREKCSPTSSALRNRANLRRDETRCACAIEGTLCPSASRAFIGRGKLLAWRDTTAEREKCPLASSAPRNRANLRRDGRHFVSSRVQRATE